MKISSVILLIFTLQLVAMIMSLEGSEKNVRSVIYNTYQHTHTHTAILWLSGFCQGQPGEPIPEETFTHMVKIL